MPRNAAPRINRATVVKCAISATFYQAQLFEITDDRKMKSPFFCASRPDAVHQSTNRVANSRSLHAQVGTCCGRRPSTPTVPSAVRDALPSLGLRGLTSVRPFSFVVLRDAVRKSTLVSGGGGLLRHWNDAASHPPPTAHSAASMPPADPTSAPPAARIHHDDLSIGLGTRRVPGKTQPRRSRFDFAARPVPRLGRRLGNVYLLPGRPSLPGECLLPMVIPRPWRQEVKRK
jgi:hypothetical protein